MAPQRPRLRYSRTLALLAASIITGVSIAVLFLTASMKPGIPTTALASIFSVLLSLGIVAIVYDIFLRGSVLYETLEIVGIKESISNVGLRNIQQGVPPDWQTLCSGAQRIAILLTNPLGWVESEWTHILDAARSHPVDVSVYIPRAEGDHVESLASRLGYARSAFVPQLTSAKNWLESTWRAEAAKSLRKGSKFTLRTYQGIAGYEIALFDDRAMIVVSDPLDRQIPVHTLVLEFSGTAAQPILDWLQAELARLDAAPTIEFSDEV